MKYFLILSFLLLSIVSCNISSDEQKQNINKKDADRFFRNYNRNIAFDELEQIDLLLERYQWPVTETGTGIRYWIYKKGNGRQIKMNDRIKCDYTLSLINGKVVYNSDNDGVLYFEIGNSNMIPGLAEGFQLLHDGDCAKLIVPSNLGYGLAGDGNKILSQTTLIYDLKNIKIVN